MLSSNFSVKHRAITRIVEESVRGQVIGMGDDVALVNSITRLVSDAVLILRMGEASFRRLNDLFILENMVAQYDDLLS